MPNTIIPSGKIFISSLNSLASVETVHVETTKDGITLHGYILDEPQHQLEEHKGQEREVIDIKEEVGAMHHYYMAKITDIYNEGGRFRFKMIAASDTPPRKKA